MQSKLEELLGLLEGAGADASILNKDSKTAAALVCGDNRLIYKLLNLQFKQLLDGVASDRLDTSSESLEADRSKFMIVTNYTRHIDAVNGSSNGVESKQYIGELRNEVISKELKF